MKPKPKDHPLPVGHLSRNGPLIMNQGDDATSQQVYKLHARMGTGKFSQRKGLEKVKPGQTVFLDWKPAPKKV